MSRIKYPAGACTPHGRYHLRQGDLPEVSLQSYNDQIILQLMGGQAIADPTRPECALIRKDGLRGLMAPWEFITQQGATEDGVTVVDALYGPIEVDIQVDLFARDGKHLAQLWRHVIASLDAKQRSEFQWMSAGTRELWWVPVRWNKPPPEPMIGPQQCHQPLTLRLFADSAFYQSYPDLDTFQFKYEDMIEEFATNDADDNGPNWPQLYTGLGAGYLHNSGGRAVWHDDPGLDNYGREVVCGPYKDFETVGDNQVVSMVIGSVPEWSGGVAGYSSGANDLWARMGRNNDGTWDGNGIRARITLGAIKLSAFVDFDEVWSRVIMAGTPEHPLPIIPFVGDTWKLVAGYEGNPRKFAIVHNGATGLSYIENGTASHLGADYRGIGFGVRAGGALFTQASPATVRRVTAGDNAQIAQSGFLERNNAGDQTAYDEYTLYGPATKFVIANGPGSPDSVEFGPLKAGEIAHIRTDPRKKAVFDYTEIIGEQVAPALFGASPSDTMYRKMKGHFTSECAIPAKEPGMRVQTYHVACSIVGGNADSKIDAQLTPLRRSPQ